MTNERRYTEDEVREIFDLATRRGGRVSRSPSPDDGLTLPELQEIGTEVGVAPERVADAAAVLDGHTETPPPGRQLGMPVSVRRTVEMERTLTDAEWEILVAECRRTFSARGTLARQEGIREWRNGNLHVSVEPTERGQRLRMGTRMGNATAMNIAGSMGLITAVIMAVVVALAGQPLQELIVPAVLFVMGGGALASNAVRLPRWAQERDGQMAYIEERVKGMIGAGREGTETDA